MLPIDQFNFYLLSEKGQRISDLSRGMEEEDPWLAYEINELIGEAYGQSKELDLLKEHLEKKEEYIKEVQKWGILRRIINNRERDF